MAIEENRSVETLDFQCRDVERNVQCSYIGASTRKYPGKLTADNGKYKPFEHRNLSHPTSTIGSFFNLLKSSLGTGLLAMPVAFKHAGIVPGCLGTLLVGLIATHCVHILVRTSRELCEEVKRPLLSYAETCEAAFLNGPHATRSLATAVRRFADVSMVGVCLGGTSVYVIFVASSLKDLIDHYGPEEKFSVEYYCLFILAPLALITQLRHLKFLVPFSVFANVCLFVTFGITCYYTMGDVPTLDGRSLVASVTEWPTFLSTSIFAMEGINVVMPVENEMNQPQYFLGCPGVLNCTMVLVSVLYGIVGLFGYLQYGDAVQGSVTLNLPQDQGLALTAKVLVTLTVFFTYCLQMYAPMEIMWCSLQGCVPLKYHNAAQIALRTSSVLFTVILAIAVPDLELLIGAVGALLFSTLGLLTPVVVETVHRWDRNLGPCKVILVKNSLLLVFYVTVLSSGFYSSFSALVRRYSDV